MDKIKRISSFLVIIYMDKKKLRLFLSYFNSTNKTYFFIDRKYIDIFYDIYAYKYVKLIKLFG